jgi:predicted DNA-binding WGR domain protein
MTRYFTCINDSSNKFWQLDIEATSILITYGKLDTAGQSLTKAFGGGLTMLKSEKIVIDK